MDGAPAWSGSCRARYWHRVPYRGESDPFLIGDVVWCGASGLAYFWAGCGYSARRRGIGGMAPGEASDAHTTCRGILGAVNLPKTNRYSCYATVVGEYYSSPVA